MGCLPPCPCRGRKANRRLTHSCIFAFDAGPGLVQRSGSSLANMPPPSTISKPPSLPSLSSSHITHSYSVRTHAFTAPSNTRAVVTAPRACTNISHPRSRTHSRLSQLGRRTNHRPPPSRPMRSTGSVTEASSPPASQTWHRAPGLPLMDSLARATIVPDGGLLCVPARDP